MILNLFKDSLMYPMKSKWKLLILGLLFSVFYSIYILESFGFQAKEFSLVSLLLSIIVTMIVFGFTLNIIKSTINEYDEVPSFNWVKNIVDGLKVFLLCIIYFIVPLLVILIGAYFIGDFYLGIGLIDHFLISGSFVDLFVYFLPHVPNSFLIVTLIGGVIFAFFGLLFLIAKATLARSENLSIAINLFDMFKKIGEIGWKNYIMWSIVYTIIIILLDVVVHFVSDIFGGIGFLLSVLLIVPYIYIFAARALGLIYATN